MTDSGDVSGGVVNLSGALSLNVVPVDLVEGVCQCFCCFHLAFYSFDFLCVTLVGADETHMAVIGEYIDLICFGLNWIYLLLSVSLLDEDVQSDVVLEAAPTTRVASGDTNTVVSFSQASIASGYDLNTNVVAHCADASK